MSPKSLMRTIFQCWLSPLSLNWTRSIASSSLLASLYSTGAWPIWSTTEVNWWMLWLRPIIATAGVTLSALDDDPLEQYDVDVGFEDEGLEDNRFKLGVVFFDFFEPASDNTRLEEGSDDEVVLSRSICFCLEEEVVLIAVDVKSTSIGSSWLLWAVTIAVMVALAADMAADVAALNAASAITVVPSPSRLPSSGSASFPSSSPRGSTWLTVDANRWACDPQAWPFGNIHSKYP